ncbi:MAG: hypothetical protein ACRD25_04220 [Terracidiphilus sp.]
MRDKISLAMEDRNPRSDAAEIPARSDEDTAAPSRAALKPAISEDPILGIPILSFGDHAPELTGEQVQKMLSDFP